MAINPPNLPERAEGAKTKNLESSTFSNFTDFKLKVRDEQKKRICLFFCKDGKFLNKNLIIRVNNFFGYFN